MMEPLQQRDRKNVHIQGMHEYTKERFKLVVDGITLDKSMKLSVYVVEAHLNTEK